MGRAESLFWAGQPEPSAAVLNNLIKPRDHLTLIENGTEIVPGLTTLQSPVTRRDI